MSKKINQKITANKVLKKAVSLLETPTRKGAFGWTKGAFGRDSSSRPVDDHQESKAACRFCAIGAIERAGFELNAPWQATAEATSRLKRVLGDHAIVDANDDPKTTFPQILMAFDLAQTSAGNR